MGSGALVSGEEKTTTNCIKEIYYIREQEMRKNTGEKSNKSIMNSTLNVIYILHIVRREMFDGPLHSTPWTLFSFA
jgi:hypothetical protein